MDNIDLIIKFMMAQQEAEDKGETTFICPNCGNTASFGRARNNGHLHCSCPGCGIRMVE